jgi:elongation factor P hydroxylase
MDVGVFVLCFEEDFNHHLGEGKDDEIWLAHESWNHDGDTRKSTGMLAR